MLVYFSANHRNIEEEVEDYRAIIDAIQRLGHVVADNWVEPAYHNIEGEKDWTAICMAATAGIEDADILIAEVTGQSGFGVGFEVASAIKSRKPVLLLVREGKSWDSYASGLDRSIVRCLEYGPQSINHIINDFCLEAKSGIRK
jgi:nucleoside 2-deoxyribosyltransferase